MAQKVSSDSGNPAPNHYKIPSFSDPTKENYGKTFGTSFEAYSRCPPSLDNSNYMSIHEVRKIPGPGTYKVERAPAYDKPKYSLYPKGKMFNDRKIAISPGAIYNPNYELVELRRYHGCG